MRASTTTLALLLLVGIGLVSSVRLRGPGGSRQLSSLETEYGGDDFCTTSNPCSAGHGDCDNDDQCAGDLTCYQRAAGQGPPPGIDFSSATHESGAGDFCFDATPASGETYSNWKGGDGCTASSPCSAGQGDCDSDDQCAGDLFCFQRAAGQVPPPGVTFSKSTHESGAGDFCFQMPEGKVFTNYLGGSGCTASKPCAAGQGDCDNDSHCAGALQCFQRGSNHAIPGVEFSKDSHLSGSGDYCFNPKQEAEVGGETVVTYASNYLGNGECTPSSPCKMGQGDCNDDDDCLGPLLCGHRVSNDPMPAGVFASRASHTSGQADYCYSPLFAAVEPLGPEPDADGCFGNTFGLLQGASITEAKRCDGQSDWDLEDAFAGGSTNDIAEHVDQAATYTLAAYTIIAHFSSAVVGPGALMFMGIGMQVLGPILFPGGDDTDPLVNMATIIMDRVEELHDCSIAHADANLEQALSFLASHDIDTALNAMQTQMELAQQYCTVSDGAFSLAAICDQDVDHKCYADGYYEDLAVAAKNGYDEMASLMRNLHAQDSPAYDTTLMVIADSGALERFALGRIGALMDRLALTMSCMAPSTEGSAPLRPVDANDQMTAELVALYQAEIVSVAAEYAKDAEEIAAMVVEAATRNYVQVHLSDKEQDFSCCSDLSAELGHTVTHCTWDEKDDTCIFGLNGPWYRIDFNPQTCAGWEQSGEDFSEQGRVWLCDDQYDQPGGCGDAGRDESLANYLATRVVPHFEQYYNRIILDSITSVLTDVAHYVEASQAMICPTAEMDGLFPLKSYDFPCTPGVYVS